MRLDNQMVCIMTDPIVYHEYFYQQYKKTKTLYESARNTGCDADRLIDIRILLAETAGKLAVTQGVLNKLPESSVVALWNNIQHKKKGIQGNLANLEAFEEYIQKVQKLCNENIPVNFNCFFQVASG